MGILQLCKFFPPDWGGVETVSHNLMQGLGLLGIENGAIAFGSSDRVDYIGNSDVISPVYRIRGHIVLKRAPASIRYFFQFRRTMRAYESVIVHLPNPFAALCVLFSGYRGRVILFWHADIVGKSIYGLLLLPLERMLIHRSDAVVAATSAQISASRHARQLQGKSHIISYPIAAQLVDIATRRAGTHRGLFGVTVRILAIGRLVGYKGFDVLIRSLALVHVHFHLDILGDGPLRDELQSVVDRFGLTKKVTLHGTVPEEVRERFLAKTDIFCLPSVTRAEMFGVVQLEAMAHGVPVISTDIPGSGAPEFTRRSGGGIVVPPGDEGALASAITQLARDGALYARLSAAGIALVSDRTGQMNSLKRMVGVCTGNSPA